MWLRQAVDHLANGSAFRSFSARTQRTEVGPLFSSTLVVSHYSADSSLKRARGLAKAPVVLADRIGLEDVLPLEPNFKTVAHEAKVVRNAALQAYSLGTTRPYVLDH